MRPRRGARGVGLGRFGTDIAELSRRARVLVVDLPGYGRSDAIELSGGEYRPYADVFAAMLSELGVERASVVGLATGGAVALAMALHHADRVDRLVLVVRRRRCSPCSARCRPRARRRSAPTTRARARRGKKCAPTCG
ncbi:Putative aminoacrylate hydrolase RutD [Streptomyces hirsutus]